jgi:predicted unusual protein kinase regulating ubiquinone biosynthesis (AarF/ABC1/UbiB family)
MRFDAFEDHAFAAASIGQARHGTARRRTTLPNWLVQRPLAHIRPGRGCEIDGSRQ